ncbi:MAG: hypothetical protein AB1656_01360 [Candidatus Omnitrophota bacterium]
MKMKYFAVFLGLSVAASSAMAQQSIKPLWEYLITSEKSPLPILKKNEPTGNEAWDGTDVYDSYGGFKRYDENRLLLGVRENGINESDPNHDAALAAQFPDRSLIWINPYDGSPMGVALTIGLKPVQLDADFLADGGSTNDYYFTFGVSDDGVIFTGYKNKILRYAPDGQGGFSGPTVAYTEPKGDPTYWKAWRWETIKASGKGKDTIVFAGGKTWRTDQIYYYFDTQDGLTFAKKKKVGFKGGGSQPYVNEFNEVMVIGGNYPGGASGFGSDIARYLFAQGSDEDFYQDPLLQFTAPALDKDNKNYLDSYIGWFLSGYAARTGLPYFAVYSTPSWDTKDSETAGTLGFSDSPVDTPYLPGWLALHGIETGEYIEGSAHMLAVYESDELDGDTVNAAGVNPASRWHGTLGDMDLYIPAAATPGSAELLWYSGIYGYGRYVIGDIGETSVANWSVY